MVDLGFPACVAGIGSRFFLLSEQGEERLPALGHLPAQGPGGAEHLGLEHPLPNPRVLPGVVAQLAGGAQVGGRQMGQVALRPHRVADLLLAPVDLEVHLDLPAVETAVRRRLVLRRLGDLVHQGRRPRGLIVHGLALAAGDDQRHAEEGDPEASHGCDLTSGSLGPPAHHQPHRHAGADRAPRAGGSPGSAGSGGSAAAARLANSMKVGGAAETWVA